MNKEYPVMRTTKDVKARMDQIKAEKPGRSYNDIIKYLLSDNDMLELCECFFRVIDKRYNWAYLEELKLFRETIDKKITKLEAQVIGLKKDEIV